MRKDLRCLPARSAARRTAAVWAPARRLEDRPAVLTLPVLALIARDGTPCAADPARGPHALSGSAWGFGSTTRRRAPRVWRVREAPRNLENQAKGSRSARLSNPRRICGSSLTHAARGVRGGEPVGKAPCAPKHAAEKAGVGGLVLLIGVPTAALVGTRAYPPADMPHHQNQEAHGDIIDGGDVQVKIMVQSKKIRGFAVRYNGKERRQHGGRAHIQLVRMIA